MRAVVWRLAHRVCGRKVSQVHAVVVGGVVWVVGVRAGVAAQRRRGDVGSLHLHLHEGGRLPDEGERVPADGVYAVRWRDGAPELAHAGGGGRVAGLALAAARRDGGWRVAQPGARAVRGGRDPGVGRPRLGLVGEWGGRDGVSRRAGGSWRRLLQFRRRLCLWLRVGYDRFSLGWLLADFRSPVFKPNLQYDKLFPCRSENICWLHLNSRLW